MPFHLILLIFRRSSSILDCQPQTERYKFLGRGLVRAAAFSDRRRQLRKGFGKWPRFGKVLLCQFGTIADFSKIASIVALVFNIRHRVSLLAGRMLMRLIASLPKTTNTTTIFAAPRRAALQTYPCSTSRSISKPRPTPGRMRWRRSRCSGQIEMTMLSAPTLFGWAQFSESG